MFKFSNSSTDSMGDAYKAMGIESTNMMRNLGTFLIAFVGIILIIISLLLLRMVMMRQELLKRIYLAIHRKIFFNVMLRSLLTSFLTLSISCLLSIDNLQFKTVGDIFSSIIAIISLLMIVAYPIFCFIFLKKNFQKLSNDDFKQRFNSIYHNLNTAKI
jgi:hypothetical protein